MNSRSSVNETNLVNFSADLSTLNQLEAKDNLLSFPFDHLYACHSEDSERPALQLDKEVEISTHCAIPDSQDLAVSSNSESGHLRNKLATFENQNKKLKDLLIFHLDLIQQQNDLITRREKLYQALLEENDNLKLRLSHMDLKPSGSSRNQKATVQTNANPTILFNVPTTHASKTVVKSETSTTSHSSQIYLNSFTDILLPDGRTNPYVFESDLNAIKPFDAEPYELPKPESSDVSNYIPTELSTPGLLESALPGDLTDPFTMIESKPIIKKEPKPESRSEALYTVTSNSGNPVIQRIQRNRRRPTSTFGSLSRMSKSSSTKTPSETETSKYFDDDKNFDHNFSVNKKSKLINTYGKNKTIPKKTTQFTGSLSDRLRLIDTTPTGEDPYQIGEAEMREQSPIPKLMLQKTKSSVNRLKNCTETGQSSSRRIYEPSPERNNKSTKSKSDRYNVSSTYIPVKEEAPKTLIVVEPDLDIVKTEPEIEWRIFNKGNKDSLCEFPYTDSTDNLTAALLPNLDSVDFQDLFLSDSPLNLDSLNIDYTIPDEDTTNEKSKKRVARSTSLVSNNEESADKKKTETKRGRKRALSTTGVAKGLKRQNTKSVEPKAKKINKKAPSRGKKSPVPGMETKKRYHTSVGDTSSWYLGLDPDLSFEDINPSGESKESTVEVPRWREKPYTSCYTLEGTENLDDKVFEKRHQKLEAEERRQLRWHMRRIREQRHVERLRQRQRDPWSGSAAPPAVHTVWPQPHQDARFIEITDTLPVLAFGEAVPALPDVDFMLPWVRTSKALKRSKRSKTLH